MARSKSAKSSTLARRDTKAKQTAGAVVRARVGRHRAWPRRAGLRRIQIWVPDTRVPGFAAEARRQTRALARAPRVAADHGFIDAVSDPGTA